MITKILPLAGFLTVLTTLPIYAQQLSPSDIWERFKLTCSQVMIDPDAFLAGIKTPGPSGERVISISPDSTAVSVYQREANGYDEVELYLIGARQIRDCSVIGEFYESDTSELATELINIVTLEGEVSISGGHAPQDYGDDGLYTVDDIFIFAIDGVFPERNLISVAHVIGGELQLSVQQSVD